MLPTPFHRQPAGCRWARLLLLATVAVLPLVLASAPPPGATATPAAPAAADWERVTQLDAGPRGQFKTQEEARAGSLAHRRLQEKTLRDFLAAHPGDEHEFEARLRLSRLLQIRAGIESSDVARVEAKRILDDLSAIASGDQHVELDFAQVAFLMRTMRGNDAAQREALVVAARRFQAEYPSDRRLAALLAEVASIFDREPETQRNLLLAAQKSCTDPALAKRIADDLKRVDLVGKPVPLHFTTRAGQTVDLAQYRGKVVVLVFFADFSPPSVEAVTAIQHMPRDWPKEAVQIIGICLDNRPEELTATLTKQGISWPIGFDGKGWMGAVPRSLGINTLPTVWIIDQDGILRSLDGFHGAPEQIRQLLSGR
jgi:peroxiredoxin